MVGHNRYGVPMPRSILALALIACGLSAAAEGLPSPTPPEAFRAAPAAGADAGRLLGLAGPLALRRTEMPVPGWEVLSGDQPAGFLASTWEVAGSIGYSGRPIDILVALTPAGVIAGAELRAHSEPILTLGIAPEDIAAYVARFAGLDLTKPDMRAGPATAGVPDVIARATVTTGVIRDGILRTARTVASARGLVPGRAGGIDRVSYAPADWMALADAGALVKVRVPMEEARAALAGAKPPLPEGEGVFLELWAGLIDPPSVGRNLLGQQGYSAAMGAAGPGEAVLFLASRGLQSHRGLEWKRSGAFERIAIVQDAHRHVPQAASFRRIDRLAIAGAPEFRELSLFRLPAEAIDPLRPFTVELTATREGAAPFRVTLGYALPERFRFAPAAAADDRPLWMTAWEASELRIAGVLLLLAVLTVILFLQESFVRRPRLWRWGRLGFLAVTLVWLGWIAGGQLSVVQVVAFLHALLSGFRWETFLMEPVIFLLWGFVALGLLFWGRGVYCGWLCPFGALQELAGAAAQRLGIRQIAVPFVLHERLWVVKYTLFLAILALSFSSMERALVLAEAEPFKTAISFRFVREWPFVLFAVALLAAGLFVERFYCRYLCPLGAALAIPAKLRLFDWLRRRPQCGRECRLCEQKCTVGAIDPLGRINPNECVLCLRCQVIHHDPATCTVLKRRAALAP
jgi:NosR/NirI family nitrite reductase transcriptional regulator